MFYWIVRMYGNYGQFNLVDMIQDHDTAVATLLGLQARYKGKYNFNIWIGDSEGYMI